MHNFHVDPVWAEVKVTASNRGPLFQVLHAGGLPDWVSSHLHNTNFADFKPEITSPGTYRVKGQRVTETRNPWALDGVQDSWFEVESVTQL